MSSVLEAAGVKKSFWNGGIETAVLTEVNLSIPEHSRLVITGASGAGKSTLLHLLASLDRPTGGKVFFRGIDLYAENDRSLSRLRNEQIGFVFQFHHLMPEFTALENVMIPLLIQGVAMREARGRAAAILERLKLADRGSHRPSGLSGGEQQRVAVARAIVGKPTLLFVDEPTGNLDRENGERLMEMLFDLHTQEGMTLVMVTHNELLANLFPRKMRLADGRLT